MPHALLLSPDDQAVSAITGVLEEMSVTCERPLDGVSAAQKLNSQSFDLVLVDCENLPAAKLIFDVCRRGKNGNNPVPIAIVDGRAGLPTAFRLGAELILTKPVAKDQARTTIRTAVGRVRKDVPLNENVPVPPPASSATTDTVMGEARAQRAAAGGISSQLTSFAETGPTFAAASSPTGASVAAAPTMKMNSAVDEVSAPSVGPNLAPKLNPKPSSFPASSLPLSEPSSAAAVAVKSKSSHPAIPSDDPVLAELERTELEASELSETAEEQNKNSEPKTTPAQPPPQVFAPVFSYQQNRQKPRGTMIALFVLLLACTGFYAAWTYQPGFREIAQPQIDRMFLLVDRGLVLAGIEHPPQPLPPASDAPKPSAKPVPAAAPATISESPTDPNQTPPIAPVSAATSSAPATNSPTASAVAYAANIPAQPAGSQGKATAAPSSAATTTAAPVVTKTTDSKPNDNKNDKKDGLAAILSSAPLPGESSAVILSSKGAEKRLSHSVPPKYPAEARSGEQGTIVLKEVVDEAGKVDGVRLVEGDATLAAAAIQAVKQWRYRPYLRDGKVQSFQTIVIIDFQHP
jgi:periplasmic protein TonB